MVFLWNLTTGRPLLMKMGDNGFCSIAFLPDGRRYAAGYDDGSITLWPTPALPVGRPIAASEHARLWADLRDHDAAMAWLDVDRLSDDSARRKRGRC